MPQPETVTVVLTFHEESTRFDRDSDIAYLEEIFERLLSEVSAFKSYRILASPTDK